MHGACSRDGCYDIELWKELLEEMEKLFAKETLTEADLIKARTLKNKLNGLYNGGCERFSGNRAEAEIGGSRWK